VPPFGDEQAQLLVVGLAPGLHGANATGRPFTGDACSDLLYGTLFEHGFSSAPRSVSRDDGLVLLNCRITNAVKCLPPQNKPTPAEAKTCRPFLEAELITTSPKVVLCLGALAHTAVVKSLSQTLLKENGLQPASLAFGHGRLHRVGSMRLVDSFHPSRYNVNTGRLTPRMFSEAVALAKAQLGG